MACLNLSNGSFSNLNWSNLGTTTSGPVTVTRAGQIVTVTRAGFTTPLTLSSGPGAPVPRYAVFGAANNVVVLTFAGSVDPFQRTVSLVNATGATLTSRELLQISLPSSAALPVITASPGNGSLLYLRTGSGSGVVGEITSVQIVRSDNGDVVLGVGGPVVLTGSDFAEITPTQLIIHHPSSGLDTTSIARPAGSLSISPAAQNFGQAILGASTPGLNTITRSFELTNNGNDCLTINGIPAVAPFSLTPASAALLPTTLDPDQSVTVSIVFTATAVAPVSRTLTVDRTPAAGPNTISCSGSARNAVASINATPSPVAFGVVPVGQTPTRSLLVTNSGEVDVTIDVAGRPVAAPSAFSWNDLAAQPLPVGSAPFPIDITFQPMNNGAAPNDTITVTPSMGMALSRTITGTGCVANAAISVPSAMPLNYGEIERGFRTVRFIEIRNTGNGDLSFRARITAGANPAHAALFGLTLTDHDITDAPATRSFNVLPAVRCGAGAVGPNTTIVAASFFANDVPGLYSANLVIDMHNDPSAPSSFLFPLSAEITDPVPVDAVLVLDRSGSMEDMIGVREKSEAAVSAAALFVQLLRDTSADRAAVVRFGTAPDVVQPMLPVAGNRAVFEAAVTPANFSPAGATNIAGGIILSEVEQATPPVNPAAPPAKKATIVLTDGLENRCFQVGGSGPWFSITGRDAADGMYRPTGFPQDTDPLAISSAIKTYAIGLGGPGDVDTAALDALATATGAHYSGVGELTAADFFQLEKYFTQIFMEFGGRFADRRSVLQHRSGRHAQVRIRYLRRRRQHDGRSVRRAGPPVAVRDRQPLGRSFLRRVAAAGFRGPLPLQPDGPLCRNHLPARGAEALCGPMDGDCAPPRASLLRTIAG